MAKDKEGNEDRGDQSRTELLQFIREVSGHAEKEISRVSRMYKIAAGCFSIIFVVGIGFTYKDAAEFRKFARDEIVEQRHLIKEELERQEKQMHERQAALFSQMQTQLSQQVSLLSQKVERRIDDEFKTENITKLVSAKAQQRIDAIADPLITDKITKKIQPKIDEADKSLTQLKGEMKAAHANLQEVKDTASFLSVVTRAQNDDRQAFDQLKKWADDPNFERRASALQAWWSIVDFYSESTRRGTILQHSNDGLKATRFTHHLSEATASKLKGASMDDLRSTYSMYSDRGSRMALLQHIWWRNDLSKRQKMGFMIEVMQNESSLRVMAEASILFQLHLIENRLGETKPLLVHPLFEWWAKNKDTISDKPEIEPQGVK